MDATTPAATTLADRAILRLSGEDVAGFLQGIVTADTNGPDPMWSGLLSPQGKVLFDFMLWRDGADWLIDCEEAQADALGRRLAVYRLRRKIGIARDPALAVHWSADGTNGAPDPRLAALGRRWLAPAGAPAHGWGAHRLSLGVCEGAAELGQDRTLWLECNARELNGVSFAKGCYVGQENTARMHYRQKVNRRLVAVRADRDPGDVARAWHAACGIAVMHLRAEAILETAGAILPEWLVRALAATEA